MTKRPMTSLPATSEETISEYEDLATETTDDLSEGWENVKGNSPDNSANTSAGPSDTAERQLTEPRVKRPPGTAHLELTSPHPDSAKLPMSQLTKRIDFCYRQQSRPSATLSTVKAEDVQWSSKPRKDEWTFFPALLTQGVIDANGEFKPRILNPSVLHEVASCPGSTEALQWHIPRWPKIETSKRICRSLKDVLFYSDPSRKTAPALCSTADGTSPNAMWTYRFAPASPPDAKDWDRNLDGEIEAGSMTVICAVPDGADLK